jgi:hypothetical protein
MQETGDEFEQIQLDEAFARVKAAAAAARAGGAELGQVGPASAHGSAGPPWVQDQLPIAEAFDTTGLASAQEGGVESAHGERGEADDPG